MVAELQAAGEAFEKQEGSFSKQRARFVAKIVIIARSLVANEDAWTKFCAAEYWRERKRDIPKAGKPSKVLLRCFQLALNAREHAQIVAASRFAKALGEFIDGESSQEEIANAIIEAGGIDGILKKQRTPDNYMCLWFEPEEFADFIKRCQNGEKGRSFQANFKLIDNEPNQAWFSLESMRPFKPDRAQ